jgi:hypothetical protein
MGKESNTRPIDVFKPTDNHFAKDFNIFFKNPDFEENKEGFLEGPGMRKLHHKIEDQTKRVIKTLADPCIEFELETDLPLPNPVSVQPRLYCHHRKEAATIGVADVVPPNTAKLRRFRY